MPWKGTIARLKTWKLRLGREGVCPSHLAGWSPATVPWPCCWPHQVSDGEERQDGCLTAPETALSTEGEWSAVLHGPHQAPWLDLGALAMVRNLLQAREWSCWPHLASHYVSSPEKKPKWRVVSDTPPSLQQLSCWCGGRERWRDGEGGLHVCQRTSLLSPCEEGRTTSATAPGSAMPWSLSCPKAAMGSGTTRQEAKIFNQQKENWELTPCLVCWPHGRCGGVMREAGWSTAPQAKPRAALCLSQLLRGRGVNLLPRPCCQ